ncbi:MAG: ABC transporter ATP-binding protein [Clostridia bacterium]|nr:ABC transporter ATP-binding protein [Clostridia bacterium]
MLFKSFSKRDYCFLFIALVLIVGQVWLDLTMPDYTANLTRSVSSGNLQMSDIWYNGLMMLLCALGSLACSLCCGFLVAQIASSFSKVTRKRLFGKITTFSSTEINRFGAPSLITRTTNDVDHLHRFIAMGLQMIIKAPILAVWAICKISVSSFEWTLATGICVAVIVVFVSIIVLLCIPKFKKVQKLTDNLNNATRENLSGVRVVRAFNAEEYQEKKFDEANVNLMKNQLFTAKATGLISPVLTICLNGLTLAIYWIGAVLINNAQIIERATIIGNMTAFTQYALQVVFAFMMLIFMFIILPRVIVSAKRINEVLRAEPVINESKSNDKPAEKEGEVEFKNVSFCFPDGASNALEDISFKIEKGETVAIIGATGSGKTTILDLLERVYDVSSGEVLVDGKNVKEFSFKQLQSKISMVSQKAVLFKGTIKSNITYGADEEVADDDERLKAAIEISEAGFVYDLDGGVNAHVAQGGTNFSGGQKQRLSIARAIFKGSEIIVFDDSFSALDYKTDATIRGKIRQQLKDKTIIIVAQRIGTIINADKIIVIDDGKIVGIGKHKELLETCSLYNEIALSQLSKEEL